MFPHFNLAGIVLTVLFLFRYKTTYGVLELFRNNDMVYSADDNKTLAQTDERDRFVRKYKLQLF